MYTACLQTPDLLSTDEQCWYIVAWFRRLAMDLITTTGTTFEFVSRLTG